MQKQPNPIRLKAMKKVQKRPRRSGKRRTKKISFSIPAAASQFLRKIDFRMDRMAKPEKILQLRSWLRKGGGKKSRAQGRRIRKNRFHLHILYRMCYHEGKR